jgi:hypothetical protein
MVTDEASAFLLSIQTELNVTKLTFAPGIIHLPNGTKVTLGKILCDTGALYGSYDTTDFYNLHLRSVQHLSQASKDIVVLATTYFDELTKYDYIELTGEYVSSDPNAR